MIITATFRFQHSKDLDRMARFASLAACLKKQIYILHLELFILFLTVYGVMTFTKIFFSCCVREFSSCCVREYLVMKKLFYEHNLTGSRKRKIFEGVAAYDRNQIRLMEIKSLRFKSVSVLLIFRSKNIVISIKKISSL